MISAEALLGYIADTESDNIERTVSTTNTDKFAEAITAFANDLPGNRVPGYLVIGATDNGRLSGLRVTDELLLNLAALRSDGNIQPLPLMNVQKFIFQGGDVAVVEVHPSDLPPVRYKGRTYIRIGPRRAVASEHEESILTAKRIAKARTFDALPCLGSGIDVLSVELFRINYLPLAVAADVLEENHRDLSTQLASLRFYDSNLRCPTNAGILLFGKNPLNWLPGAYIQFLRIDGTKLSDDVLSEKQISGDLLTVLRELDSLVELHLQQRPVHQSTLREEIYSDYPAVALRELLMNAVLHRSYESTGSIRLYWFSDRVEIQNPGGLYGEASRENFPQQNSYRNPILAEAMKTLGFVNRFGRGVVRAQAALEKNGNPPAEFTLDLNYTLALVRKRQ